LWVMMALARASPSNLVQLGCIMAESSLAYSGRLSVSEQGVNPFRFRRPSKGGFRNSGRNNPATRFTNEPPGTAAFYRSLDEHRYKVHPRLQSAVDFEKTPGLRVLEIGCGSVTERFARAGGRPDNSLSQVLSSIGGSECSGNSGMLKQKSCFAIRTGSRASESATRPGRGLACIALRLAPLDLRTEAPSGIHGAEKNSQSTSLSTERRFLPRCSSTELVCNLRSLWARCGIGTGAV
jgi:hypothetical protein